MTINDDSWTKEPFELISGVVSTTIESLDMRGCHLGLVWQPQSGKRGVMISQAIELADPIENASI